MKINGLLHGKSAIKSKDRTALINQESRCIKLIFSGLIGREKSFTNDWREQALVLKRERERDQEEIFMPHTEMKHSIVISIPFSSSRLLSHFPHKPSELTCTEEEELKGNLLFFRKTRFLNIVEFSPVYSDSVQ